MMPAPIGNNFYKFVSKPTGRPKKYSARMLWNKAQEYFTWVNKNPLYEKKAFSNGETVSLPKMRAMTEMSFCRFAGISRDTWHNYKSGNNENDEFSDICGAISDIIYDQKFTGAAAGLLNPAIIVRELGLGDKTELSGPGGKPLASQVVLTKEEFRYLSQVLDEELET